MAHTPPSAHGLPRATWSRLAEDRLLAQCEVDTYRASGPGGQKRNKTSSAVRLRHPPTGLIVIAEESRSQHENKAKALKRLWHALFLDLRDPLPPDVTPEAVAVLPDYAAATRFDRVLWLNLGLDVGYVAVGAVENKFYADLIDGLGFDPAASHVVVYDAAFDFGGSGYGPSPYVVSQQTGAYQSNSAGMSHSSGSGGGSSAVGGSIAMNASTWNRWLTIMSRYAPVFS